MLLLLLVSLCTVTSGHPLDPAALQPQNLEEALQEHLDTSEDVALERVKRQVDGGGK